MYRPYQEDPEKTNYPADLAEAVVHNWFRTGKNPPAEPTLRKILETCYQASLHKDEGRELRFTVCFCGNDKPTQQHTRLPLPLMKFTPPRSFSYKELRKLGVLCDTTSAICVLLDQQLGEIIGLLALDYSRVLATKGRLNSFNPPPEGLIVTVSGPGELTVHNGLCRVASLRRGRLEIATLETSMPMQTIKIHSLFSSGLTILQNGVTLPSSIDPREAENTEWAFHTSTFAAIANQIRDRGHGGAIILVPPDCKYSTLKKSLRVKYKFHATSQPLRKAFVRFLRAEYAEVNAGELLQEWDTKPRLNRRTARLMYSSLAKMKALEQLNAAITTVGNLSAVDGAIVLRTDLKVVGFGVEIVATRNPSVKFMSVPRRLADLHFWFGEPDDAPDEPSAEPIDPEQFGMRHRSALALCSTVTDVAVLVVSQDGDVSLVWREENTVYLKRNIVLAHANSVFP